MIKPKTAYICLVDWDYHVDADWNGTVIYPSLTALKRERQCVEQCGIARVKVYFDKLIKKERITKGKK